MPPPAKRQLAHDVIPLTLTLSPRERAGVRGTNAVS